MIYWQGQTSPNPKFILTMSISISILNFFLPQGSADFLFLITSHQTSSNPKFITISLSISNSISKLFPHRCGRSVIYWQSKTFPHPHIHTDNHFKLQFSMFLLHNLIGFLLADKTKPHPNPKFILSRPIFNYVVFLKNANRNYSIFHNLWHSVKNWAPGLIS